MIRIRTTVGNKRVFTIFHGDEWITLASGLESKSTTSYMEAGQNHLMAARSLYLKMQEEEHRRNQIDLGPRPGEVWNHGK